jgi:hypothetical protein
VALPRLRSDSQGSLSIVNPAGLGSYGGRLDVPLGPLAELVGGEHILEIRPLQPGSDMKVVLFGPLLGRAPLGPTLVLDDGLGPRA